MVDNCSQNIIWIYCVVCNRMVASRLHHRSVNTDGNGTTIRTILFDYRKAFDFIDHAILVNKVGNLDIPCSIVNWIIDFLSHRTQRVKLAKGCYCEWGPVLKYRRVPH